MSSLESVTERLRQVLDRADQAIAHIHASTELLNEAFELLSGVLNGSGQSDSEDLLATFALASSTCEELVDALAQARGRVDAILARVAHLIGETSISSGLCSVLGD